MGKKIKREVTIHAPSYEYLNVKEQCKYTQVHKEIKNVKGRCIIHLYPKADTFCSDDSEELEGYCDALLFQAQVFDVDNRVCYKSDTLYDNINIKDINVESRIYKDLSSMYIFDSPVEIKYNEEYNTLNIHKEIDK